MLGIENIVDRVHRNLVLGRFSSNFMVGYFLCLSVPSCHQISWNRFILDLLAKIIVLGNFNLNYLSKKEVWGHIDGSNPVPRDAEALSK